MIAGILIAVLGHVFLKPLCVLLGSTPTILPYTEKYLGVILLGTPLMLRRWCSTTRYVSRGTPAIR